MIRQLVTSFAMLTLVCGQGYAAAPASTSNQAVKAQQSSVNTLSARLRDAFLQQIATEQYSSNLYLTFASYFGDVGLDGCEKYFRHSAAEESEHALLFYDLLIDRGEKFQLKAVEASAFMPTSTLEAFTKLVENEMKVSKAIYNLYAMASEENDYASQAFLHQFLLIQVQEEKEVQDLLRLIEMGPNDPALIMIFDEKVSELAGD